MASLTPSKTELLQRLAEIEKRASSAGASIDAATAKAAESELGLLFPVICDATGVPFEEAQQSPPWFPPQPPTKAYLLQYARVFLSVISIADVTGSPKVVSEARKTAFEVLRGVVGLLRAALT